MSKKSIYGLFIALAIPVFCYLWLKSASKTAVTMPRHYLLDTVMESVVDGKQKSDSIWHTTKNIRLVNQLGDSVNLYDQQGKIIILDLFFTSCGSICPKLTNNMSKLQQSFSRGGDVRKKLDTNIAEKLEKAFKSEMELELSTEITKGVFIISSVLFEIIGFINKSKTQNTVVKRNKAKTKCTFNLILAL